jgi:beta-barrel assembly-enhancing protease
MKKLIPLSLFTIGILLSLFIYRLEKKTAYKINLAPFFQILGKPIKSFNSALTKLIPIDELDEKEYGDAIKLRYQETANDSDLNYINDLRKYKNKPFDYKGFILHTDIPNAFAMPGGVIFITKGLLENLESESELISILGHEIGHIERSHCMDAIRFELLTKKIGADTLGNLADIAFQFFIKSSYSKTQENEADEYSFEILSNTDYDTDGAYHAFEKLKNLETITNEKNIVFDYFQSHPDLEIRIEKFKSRSQTHKFLHPNKLYYIGRENYQSRIPISKGILPLDSVENIPEIKNSEGNL